MYIYNFFDIPEWKLNVQAYDQYSSIYLLFSIPVNNRNSS